MHLKLSESWQVHVGFCSTKLNQCVLRLGTKWILNYLDIPNKWFVKSSTSLAQTKVTSLELGRFVLKDEEAFKDPTHALVNGISNNKYPTNVDVTPHARAPEECFFCPSEISL